MSTLCPARHAAISSPPTSVVSAMLACTHVYEPKGSSPWGKMCRWAVRRVWDRIAVHRLECCEARRFGISGQSRSGREQRFEPGRISVESESHAGPPPKRISCRHISYPILSMSPVFICVSGSSPCFRGHISVFELCHTLSYFSARKCVTMISRLTAGRDFERKM